MEPLIKFSDKATGTADYVNNNYNEKATILIVEDHNALRSSLLDWLQSVFHNCEFLVAESGEEAVKLASAHSLDIVLMDIQLPRMDGIETIRYIKGISPQTHAVIVSVYNYPAYLEAAAAAGACAYINKHSMHIELIPTLIKLLPAKLVAELNIKFSNLEK